MKQAVGTSWVRKWICFIGALLLLLIINTTSILRSILSHAEMLFKKKNPLLLKVSVQEAANFQTLTQ